MVRLIGAASLALMLFVSPTVTWAQGEEEPEFHYVTVTTFSVPLGEEGNDVMMWVDSVMLPLARVNPNVVSMEVGRHQWGSNSGHVIMISRYDDWDAIAADCGAPCEEWNEANPPPEEGTPRAEKWDRILANFLKYYTGHNDEIYIVPASRTK